MNKKGFTLVELLAVIVILGILISLAVPSVFSVLDNSKNKINDAKQKEYESLARIWGNDFADSLSNNQCYFMSLNYMVKNGLSADLPEDIDEDVEKAGVEITKKNNRLNYQYSTNSSCQTVDNLSPTLVDYSDDETIVIASDDKVPTTDPTVKYPDIEQVYSEIGEDTTGANKPEFDKVFPEAVPVVYDESCDYDNGCWRVADPSKNWYNYGKGIWANIAILSPSSNYCNRTHDVICLDEIAKHPASYYKNNLGIQISMDDIQSMYVWIPQFSVNNVDTSRGDYPNIDVTFTNIANVNTSSLHRAFIHTTKLKVIKGFWVQKFEGNKMYAKISRYQKTNGGDTSDVVWLNDVMTSANLITNFEWGAIEYLAYSQYGIKNNSICNGQIKPTYQYSLNKTDSYKVSYSGVSYDGNQKYISYDGRQFSYFGGSFESANPNQDIYLNDPIENRQSAYCKSTSGTVYGVYDMAGGFPEFTFLTMKNKENKQIEFVGRWITSNKSEINGCQGTIKKEDLYIKDGYVTSITMRRNVPGANTYPYNDDENNSKGSVKYDGMKDFQKYAEEKSFPYCGKLSSSAASSVYKNVTSSNRNSFYEAHIAMIRGSESIFDFSSTRLNNVYYKGRYWPDLGSTNAIMRNVYLNE